MAIEEITVNLHPRCVPANTVYLNHVYEMTIMYFLSLNLKPTYRYYSYILLDFCNFWYQEH